jgi:hypothetical protein
MAGNSDPIYSRQGVFGQSMILKAAANDYTGTSPYNREVFVADPTNGGYLQKIRFKAMGTNVATVARIYINRGGVNTNFATPVAAPTGTPSTTGGTMLAGTYYAVVIAIGPGGSQTVATNYSAAVNTTGSTGSISWSWAAVPGAESYRIYVSPWVASGATYATFATRYAATATNSYTQTTMLDDVGTFDDPTVGNQFLFDEVSLPATTASATAATVTVDVPMNLALPPGYEVYCGLGTAVAAGWSVVGIGGAY